MVGWKRRSKGRSGGGWTERRGGGTGRRGGEGWAEGRLTGRGMDCQGEINNEGESRACWGLRVGTVTPLTSGRALAGGHPLVTYICTVTSHEERGARVCPRGGGQGGRRQR